MSHSHFILHVSWPRQASKREAALDLVHFDPGVRQGVALLVLQQQLNVLPPHLQKTRQHPKNSISMTHRNTTELTAEALNDCRGRCKGHLAAT